MNPRSLTELLFAFSPRSAGGLLVFGANQPQAEALATLHLPHRVRFGFHANWRRAPRATEGRE